MSADSGQRPINRRAALQQGALVTGALVWTPPTLEVFRADASAADLASEGPATHPTATGSASPSPDISVRGTRTAIPEASQPGAPGPGAGAPSGALAGTGAAVSPITAGVVGAGLLAAGAALRRWAHERSPDRPADGDRSDDGPARA